MQQTPQVGAGAGYEPRLPTLTATGFFVLFIVILALPMLRGKWLAAPMSDQYASAYAVHEWQAEQWRATGQLPLWNPMIMDGLPYIAVVTHGDVLYPTSFLRWKFSADKVTNFGFVLHYILAGMFMFLLLRRLRISWTGSVVGGVAYQLTGILISYARPGHDGKLFVSTMLPLACLALVVALRDRRAWGYPLLAVAVALCLLSPHVQTTYYLLIATGLWALYLTFGEPTSEPLAPRLTRLAIVLAAVIAGFGIAMPQILPFLEYIPHSPRAVAYSGAFESAASYGVPWDHVPEFFLAGFTGGGGGTYWGSNPIKLHSEYLGLPVILLAILGLRGQPERRRLIWWLGGICILFLLIALGNATPFYKLWWSVMPYVRKTRAPGMVFFVVAFCTASLAALGTSRLERKEGEGHVRTWLILSGVIALLGLAGAFGHLAESLAPLGGGRRQLAEAWGPDIRVSALIGAVLLFAVALVAFAYLRGKAPVIALALGLPLLVGADLWRDGRHFWLYSDPPNQSLYRLDPLTTRLKAVPKPFRVLDFNVYPENVLMAHGIPQVLGYQGNELRYFDELIGGRPGTQNEARFLVTSTKLWDLLAVRYLLITDTVKVPGYHRVMGPVQTAGNPGYLYEADTAPPYARVVPAAVKVDADSLVPPTLADPRFPPFDRVVLLPSNSPIKPRPLQGVPPASPSRAHVTAWDAGRMIVELDPPPAESSYVLIAENWYLDWRVNVDGHPGQVLRGDHALLTVPVGPGTKRLELSYHSRAFARGKAIGLVTLLLVIAGFVVPPVWERRRTARA
ncbi:MAG: hypothetical protein DMD62_00635 [Gemmatimonadetes bacterium]|nr:MAG: hypothetical protein DMD62_00635 [Gemmatimonadota bacterium]